MKQNWEPVTFGLIEIAIGSITLIVVSISFILGKSTKPPEVLIFVLTTAAISLGLGIGIIGKSRVSYRLLLLFSAVIILSKALILAKIVTLTGALETALPPSFKNIISVVYHSLLIWFFTRSKTRRYFKERRDILFPLR